jgi:hypothetical protein
MGQDNVPEQKFPAESSPLRVWLDSFRDAWEAVERAEKRRGTIPELGRIVKEKSTAAMEEYWRQNRDKSDAERGPFPRPRDTVEQQEIEQILEDHSVALNRVVMVRGELEVGTTNHDRAGA